MDELAHAAVAADPPCVPLAEIRSAVEHQYGICGDYSTLVSERDQNFRLRSASGPDYVVKVASLAEPPSASEFQVCALLHLENIAMPGVPRVIRTCSGQASGAVEYAGSRYILRVVSYLPGVPLASVELRPHLARELGGWLARLDLALQGLSHEGEKRLLLWDLQRAPELQRLLDNIDVAATRRSVAHALDDYESAVVPLLADLRYQVVHGDANPGNVLTDPDGRHVNGFIDFGDMVRAPLIFDVAIAAAYLRPDGADPLQLIGPFARAYNSALPLTEIEVALLFDLVRTRLATTITLLFWRLGARHDNDPYRNKTLEEEAGAVHFLAALDALGRAAFAERLRGELSG